MEYLKTTINGQWVTKIVFGIDHVFAKPAIIFIRCFVTKNIFLLIPQIKSQWSISCNMIISVLMNLWWKQ